MGGEPEGGEPQGGEDDAPFDPELTDLEIEPDEDEADEEEEEGEDGEEGEVSESEDGPVKKKPKKEEVDDDAPKHPDTKVPSAKAMLSALEWAFEGEDNVPEGLLEKYCQHALFLLKTNSELNLTSVLESKEVAAKHYLDSWRLTRLLPLMAKTVLDLGSGGGFPGIPLALAEPMLSMVLCEASEKKAAYLKKAVAELGLKNVRVVNARAEEWLVDEKVNMVVVRAVSSVRENIRTLRKVRHSLRDFVMIKGTSWSRELRAAEREAERLGFRLDTVWEHDLPEEMGHRVVLVYRAPGGMGR